MFTLSCSRFVSSGFAFRDLKCQCSVQGAPAVQSAGLKTKLMLAKSLDKLDLTDLQLVSIPEEVWDLPNLTELSLTGNQLSELPHEISNLTNLELLQLAGNCLEDLPEELGTLKKLKGLWLYGNQLRKLPDSFGGLESLERCSLSGNQLETLPESFNQLMKLMEMYLPGNKLNSLPEMDGLKALRKLTLHGNYLVDLPESLSLCNSLTALSLQGNKLEKLDLCPFPVKLKSLNLADNELEKFPAEQMSRLVDLEELTLYGNRLRGLPPEVLELPKLKRLWLEGNPLDQSCLVRISKQNKIEKIGLDFSQKQDIPDPSNSLSFSQVPLMQKGYFKLVQCSEKKSDLLVVAFGSAPGNPNWAGVLKKIQKENLLFDVLFVVDPHRSWYGVHNENEFQHYHTNLKSICQTYSQSLMIGDSMGASGALLFADLATSVLAICPQIDFQGSYFRPCLPRKDWSVLRTRILRSVKAAKGQIEVMTGNWIQDLEQLKFLKETNYNSISHTVVDIESHHISQYLNHCQKLDSTIKTAILKTQQQQ